MKKKTTAEQERCIVNVARQGPTRVAGIENAIKYTQQQFGFEISKSSVERILRRHQHRQGISKRATVGVKEKAVEKNNNLTNNTIEEENGVNANSENFHIAGEVKQELLSTTIPYLGDYEVGTPSSSAFNDVHQNPFENAEPMAFENAVDNDFAVGNDPVLDSKLKAAKIAYFEAQTEFTLAQASESRAREHTEKVKAELAAAQIETERIRAKTIESESRARGDEARANERLTNIRTKLLELEYQEKIQNRGKTAPFPNE